MSLGDNGKPAGRVLAQSKRERGGRILAPVGRKGLAALVLSFCFMVMASGFAQAETRALKRDVIHTKERAEITFKKNGQYGPAGRK